MEKIFWFIFLVAIGAGGILVFSNRDKTSSDQLVSLTPSPTQDQKLALNSTIIPSPTSGPTPTPAPIELPQPPVMATQAAIITTKGEFVISLYTQDAPNTVKNFVTKSESKFYNNLSFHRVEDWVVQGGDPKGNGTGGGEMITELNSKPFVEGSVGVARRDNIQISNDAQFFVTKREASWLNQQYTNFGIVTSGMDVVKNLKVGDKIVSITIR